MKNYALRCAVTAMLVFCVLSTGNAPQAAAGWADVADKLAPPSLVQAVAGEVSSRASSYSFSDLRQDRATLHGKKIGPGSGLVFRADATPDVIADALRRARIVLDARMRRNITVLQRYFPRRASSRYVIEFRRKVRHYSVLRGSKIIVDVALLRRVEPRDLLPFLAFLLGHEGSHGMNDVADDEDEVRRLDVQRFSAFGASHQASVLRALAQLGASPAYLAILRAIMANKPRVLALKNPDPAIRQAAVVQLHQSQWTPQSAADVRAYQFAMSEWTKGPAFSMPPVQTLIHALQSRDKAVRRAAVMALGELEVVEAVRPLMAAAEGAGDEDEYVRGDALQALGKLGDRRATVLLATALEDSSESDYVRWSAATGLGWLKNERAMPCLLRALEDDDADVANAAVDALAKHDNVASLRRLHHALKQQKKNSAMRVTLARILGKLRSPLSVPPLAELLADRVLAVRQAAVRALSYAGPEDMLRVAAHLDDKRMFVRQAAARVLQRRLAKSEAMIDFLIARLRSPHWDVRQACAKYLGQGEVLDATPALMHALQAEKTAAVQVAIINALISTGGSPMGSHLSRILKFSPHGSVRQAAARGLRILRWQPAKGPLIQALQQDKDKRVQQEAAHALSTMPDKDTSRALADALSQKHQDASLRRAVAKALGMSGGEVSVRELLKAWQSQDKDNFAAAQDGLELLKPEASMLPLFLKAIENKPDVRDMMLLAHVLARMQPFPDDAMSAALLDKTVAVRVLAAKALGIVRCQTALPALKHALLDKDVEVRAAAAVALGHIGNAQATVALCVRLNHDTRAAVRLAAAVALQKMGDARAAEPLQKALQDGDVRVATEAAKALPRVMGGKAAIAVLKTQLKTVSARTIVFAEILKTMGWRPQTRDEQLNNIIALEQWHLAEAFGADAVLPLMRAFADPRRYAPAQAPIFGVLSRLKDKRSLEHLRMMLLLRDSPLRGPAAGLLGAARDRASVPLLIKALGDRNEAVRWQAIEALESIGEDCTGALVPVLLSDAETPRVRVAAARALGKTGNAMAVAALLPCIEINDAPLRQAAARALLAGRLPSWQRVIDEVLKCPYADVRLEGAKVLQDRAWNPVGRRQEVLYYAAAGKLSDVAGAGRLGISRLTELLKDMDEGIRGQAAYQLGLSRSPLALAPLEALLVESHVTGDDGIVQIAARALARHKRKGLDLLISMLQRDDGNLSHRVAALRALGKFRAFRFNLLPSITPLLKDKEVSLRRQAVLALGELRARMSVDDMVEALQDEDAGVRANAAAALGMMRAGKAGSYLAGMLRDRDNGVRLSAIRSLGVLRYANAVRDLMPCLEDGDGNIRLAACEALGDIHEPAAIPGLIALLQRETELRPRKAILRVIGAFDQADAARAIIEVADKEEKKADTLGALALELLRYIKGPDVVEVLLEALGDDKRHPYVRQAIAAGLDRWDDAKVTATLIKTFARIKNPIAVRTMAAESMHNLAKPECLAPLIRALRKDKSAAIREVSAMALGAFGDRRAIRPLLNALLDRDFPVNESAGIALMQLANKAAFRKVMRPAVAKVLAGRFLRSRQSKELLARAPFDVLLQLVIQLSYRRREIYEKVFLADEILSIYSNASFMQQTRRMEPANRFSMARAVLLALHRFHAPITGRCIEIVFEHLVNHSSGHMDKPLLGPNRHLIAIQHVEGMFNMGPLLEFAESCGVSGSVTHKGKQQKSHILDAIRSAPPDTTIWFNGHGGPKHCWLEEGTVGYERSDNLTHTDAISHKEFAQVLMERAGRHGGRLSDICIVLDSCYSADFAVRLLNEIKSRELPLIVTAANRKAFSYGNVFLRAIRSVTGKSRQPLLLRHVMQAEGHVANYEDIAMFLPASRASLLELKRQLRPYAARAAGMRPHRHDHLGPDKRAMEHYQPLTQDGGMSEAGEAIGSGLIFAADVAPWAMAQGLERAGVDPPVDMEALIARVQQYFSIVHEAGLAPDKTRAISDYRVELRRDMRHYAALEGNTIVLDVALLNIDPEDLFPFLVFILGHEGSHAIVGDEAAAQAMDRERFRAMSDRHQQSVLSVLLQLGAEVSTIDALLKEFKFGEFGEHISAPEFASTALVERSL